MSDPMYKLYTIFKPPKDPNETHAPKLLRGKVALCRDCGCFSRDISQCIGCKKKFPEGTLKVHYFISFICLHSDISLFTGIKILPDPHHKPRKYQKKSNGNDSSKKDKNDATISNKPEYIALDSDEETEVLDGESRNSVQEHIDEMNEGVQDVVVVAVDDLFEEIDRTFQLKFYCFLCYCCCFSSLVIKTLFLSGFVDCYFRCC